MKHVIIGDLHGRDIWKRVNFSSYGKAGFPGDYVDSFNRSDRVILKNLEEIIALKKRYPEKIVLLLGNHDVQYFHYPKYPCPGFRETMQPDLTNLFNENRGLFQIACQRRDFLFTHAGITNRWWRAIRQSFTFKILHHPGGTIADTINRIEHETQHSSIFAYSRYRTGHDSNGGPLWADYMETFQDALDGYHQFVGHGPQDEPKHLCWRGKSITYLDVLHKQPYFHELHC